MEDLTEDYQQHLRKTYLQTWARGQDLYQETNTIKRKLDEEQALTNLIEADPRLFSDHLRGTQRSRIMHAESRLAVLQGIERKYIVEGLFEYISPTKDQEFLYDDYLPKRSGYLKTQTRINQKEQELRHWEQSLMDQENLISVSGIPSGLAGRNMRDRMEFFRNEIETTKKRLNELVRETRRYKSSLNRLGIGEGKMTMNKSYKFTRANWV